MTTVEYKYDDNGDFYTLIIEHHGEKIQVMHKQLNGATAEFQRADDIVKAMLKSGIWSE